MSHTKLCCSCGAFFEAADGPELQCPHCGWRISFKEYKALLSAAQGAVKFGWQYRRRYEADMAEYGRIERYYALPECEEALQFAALAAASGVIGGLAYDAVKRVIRKIAAAVKRDGKQSAEASIFYLIDHPEEMDRFIRYIDEYYACFDRISEEVRNAVLAEMVMDKMSPTMEQLLEESDPDLDLEDIRSISPFTEEELFRGMLEVRRDIDRRRRLGREDFAGFWENVDQRCSGDDGQEPPLEREDKRP